MADVILSASAARELDKLPRVVHLRVMRIIERLAQWPVVSGAKSLRGSLAGHYRIRTGDYRVQFHLKDQSVVVEKISHRDGFYEE